MINNGIAFICEGETELVFYEALIDFYCGNDVSEYQIEYTEIGEKYRTVTVKENYSIIKMDCVSTISQITNSAQWLNHECFKAHPDIPWTVFLCYDTDSYKQEITQFYEGDWKNFREEIFSLCPNADIVDLAARAEIEDLLILDAEGIAKYLNVSDIVIPASGKGKGKIKSIFRKHGKIYHEGKRAGKLINSLNMMAIIEKSPIKLELVRKAIFELNN